MYINYCFQPPEDEQVSRLIKGHLMQSKQQQLLEFWMWREHVIELCKHLINQLVEGFVSERQHEYVQRKMQ